LKAKEEVSMSIRNLALIAALLWTTTALGQSESAHADIVNVLGQQIGTAQIRPSGSGIRIDVKVSQLTPGMHGIHVHNVGKCEGPAFASAGPHFNPAAKQHGKDNPGGPHAGDLLMVKVGADGKGKTSLRDPNATLGGGPNSIFHDGGTSLVIHADPDDYKTDPAGNSGARIACGVIEK
jgi:Cu-Zn family superoxide dismutase